MTVFLVSINSCKKDEFQIDNSGLEKSGIKNNVEPIEIAQKWYYDNPKENQYPIIEASDKIEWNKAVVHNVDTAIIVEIPIKLKDKYLVKIEDNNYLNVEHRLLIIEKGIEVYSLLEFFISTETKENLGNINRFNYSTRDTNFIGTFLLVNINGEIAFAKDFREESLNTEIKLKSYIIEEHCVVLVDIQTGAIVDVFYCYLLEIGNGDSGTSGGSSSTTSIPEVITDSSFKNSKTECVKLKLENGNSNSILNKLLAGFNIENSPIALTYKIGQLDGLNGKCIFVDIPMIPCQ